MLVPPWIPAAPKLFVVGQSPGAVEARCGRPFVGPAGRQLRLWLTGLGLDADTDVAYTNVTNDYHPEAPNYLPSPAEIKRALPRVAAEVGAAGPSIRAVLLCGAAAAHLLFKGGMTQMQGQRATWVVPALPEACRSSGAAPYPVLPCWACYHPAYYLRARSYKQRAEIEGDVLAVLREVVAAATGEPTPAVVLPTPVYAEAVCIV